MTPDEKRKSRGEKIIKMFLSKQVSPQRNQVCVFYFKAVKTIKVTGKQCVNVFLCPFVSTQSPQHVDIAEVFADQCRENLERSPCKDIFSNCRK